MATDNVLYVRTSAVPPMGGDNGNKTNPGIKKIGNHFASNAAPGVRKV